MFYRSQVSIPKLYEPPSLNRYDAFLLCPQRINQFSYVSHVGRNIAPVVIDGYLTMSRLHSIIVKAETQTPSNASTHVIQDVPSLPHFNGREVARSREAMNCNVLNVNIAMLGGTPKLE